MSLFEQLGHGQPMPQKQMTMQEAVQQIKGNPAGMLKRAGLNVPQNMTNPQQIVNHLVQSGQVPQSRLAQAMQMLGGRR